MARLWLFKTGKLHGCWDWYSFRLEYLMLRLSLIESGKLWRYQDQDYSSIVQSMQGRGWGTPIWFPKELSYMKALGKVVAVNLWKVWEECTARRKRDTGNLIHQTSHWQFNSLIVDSISKKQICCSSHPVNQIILISKKDLIWN